MWHRKRYEKEEELCVNHVAQQFVKEFRMKKLPPEIQIYIWEIAKTKDMKELTQFQDELHELFFLQVQVPESPPRGPGVPCSWTITPVIQKEYYESNYVNPEYENMIIADYFG